MGFRDIRAFNLALLAKQGWRIQKNLNSLVHRVFNAKHFAESSFLEAQLGRKPSYVWRSIWTARKVIEKGSCWVIGNGESVQMWKDRWLPTPDSFKVVSPRIPHADADLVANLIDRERKSWETAKVQSTFLPHEVEVIFGIPISPQLPEDSIIWTWSSNGRFITKSAYRVVQKCLKEGNPKQDSGNSSDNSQMQAIWNLIWNLRCPNKIKHFMWRSFKNILPTKERLRIKGVTQDNGCDLCGLSESSGHILWGCKGAADVWSATKIKLPLFPNPPREFIDVMWEIKENRAETDWELFAVTAWCL